ncbi:putative RNA polymerase [Achromobacter phage vB_AxyP_19-32_Axy22]|uniref:Putative RNA polymerase n=1 Tax=Achromobacter phage vB_AxyP_19-32_Axy22 TaxID=2591046 RepID=A0A514CVW9_9CAUD|nr:putative RNA polymerase [Achromobacter phage vB_AxyP_19-32_Axy22]
MSKFTYEELVAHQNKLEVLFNCNQLMSRMRKEFTESKNPDFVAYMQQHGMDPKFGIDALVQIALHKRADLPTLLGTLRHHGQTAQEVADGLLWLAQHDFMHWEPVREMFIVIFEISAEVQHEIDSYQYPLPMVIEPRHLENNRQSGYLISQGSVILKKNHTEDDVCLDHLNRMNKVALTINYDTVGMIQNKWKNLDKVQEGETREDFEKRKRAFDKYNKTAHEVMAVLTHMGNRFYITHKYDKRGRTYAQGYHVNYQGTPWNKAVVEFADAEVIQ